MKPLTQEWVEKAEGDCRVASAQLEGRAVAVKETARGVGPEDGQALAEQSSVQPEPGQELNRMAPPHSPQLLILIVVCFD